MAIKRYLIIIIFFLIPSVASAFPGTSNSLKIKDWQILIDGEESLVSVKLKDGWKPIDISSKFRMPYTPGADFRRVWLRAEFETDNREKYFGVSLGRVYLTHRIYINGSLMDSKGPDEIGNLHLPVNFILPQNALRSGANEIYVNLGLFRSEWGGMPDGVYVQPKFDFRKTRHMYDFLFNQLPIGILLLMLFGIIRMLFMFIMERKETFFLYAALMLSLNSIYIVTIFSPYKLFGFRYLPVILLASGPLFGIIFILIIQSLYRLRLRENNSVMFAIIILVMISTLLIQVCSPYYFLKSMIALVIVILFLPYISYMIYRLNKIKPDRFKFYATLVLANAMGLSGIAEIVFYIMGSRYSLLMATYFAPFLILGFAVLGTRDYQNRILELRILYDKLVEGRKETRRQIVTDSTGGKIREIIDFINDNYRSDLSREGLAAAVGMNPNYFSGQFKEFTGKRIGDYINELRIKEAAEKLKEKDARIIDVALSAGFDSLSTFNRVFKNIMGKSPTEFRKD